jgi:hypothetical protein
MAFRLKANEDVRARTLRIAHCALPIALQEGLFPIPSSRETMSDWQ